MRSGSELLIKKNLGPMFRIFGEPPTKKQRKEMTGEQIEKLLQEYGLTKIESKWGSKMFMEWNGMEQLEKIVNSGQSKEKQWADLEAQLNWAEPGPMDKGTMREIVRRRMGIMVCIHVNREFVDILRHMGVSKIEVWTLEEDTIREIVEEGLGRDKAEAIGWDRMAVFCKTARLEENTTIGATIAALEIRGRPELQIVGKGDIMLGGGGDDDEGWQTCGKNRRNNDGWEDTDPWSPGSSSAAGSKAFDVKIFLETLIEVKGVKKSEKERRAREIIDKCGEVAITKILTEK